MSRPRKSAGGWLSVAALLAACVTGAAALAQELVPRDLYTGGRRAQESKIIFCLWPTSPTKELDRAIATDLAGSLLLEAEFYEVILPSITEDEQFQQALFIALADHCDAAMALNLAWAPLPAWLTIAGPYYNAPYVMALREPGYASLGEVPRDRIFGSLMGSLADFTFANYLAQLPADQRWRRFPYDSGERLVDDLRRGFLQGALIDGPSLYAATGGDPEAEGIHVISTAPLQPEPQRLGIALRNTETFTRTVLDEAIREMRSSGRLATLLAEYGMPQEQPGR